MEGGASCVGSVGTLCSSLEVGMVSQGVNSMIENGYYLERNIADL